MKSGLPLKINTDITQTAEGWWWWALGGRQGADMGVCFGPTVWRENGWIERSAIGKGRAEEVQQVG